MGFLEVLAGVTKIKVAPNDLLGPSEASETHQDAPVLHNSIWGAGGQVES